MSRVRKTRDEWVIQGHYGQGWEDECSEDSRKDAKEQIRCYRENSPYPVRLIKRRVRIEVAA